METEKKFSQQEGASLLRLARGAIEARFAKIVPFASFQREKETFSQKRGVFVTLWLKGVMRGCMGIPWPHQSLEKSVQETALQSAFGDARYPPIKGEEVPHLQIEVTVLTPPKSVEVGEVQLGVHGLIIHREEGSGLLLPHIPLEQGWDVKTFLAATCLKGRLPPDAWEEGDIYAFEVEIFRENFTPFHSENSVG